MDAREIGQRIRRLRCWRRLGRDLAGVAGFAPSTLFQAEQVAPEELRGHRLTRGVLSDLLGRERRGAVPGLRSLADRCGEAA
jgi:hypothetical protein